MMKSLSEPETDLERERVLEELQSIISSHHFRNSKRYPALLKYVVIKTLDGEAGYIKERTLGIEVFDRLPDYDTNADPVVRFSAGAIRRKIAQYYQEIGNDSELQIDLPVGSYVPEFRRRIPNHNETPHRDRPRMPGKAWVPVELQPVGEAPPRIHPDRARFLPRKYLVVAAILALGASVAMLHLWRVSRGTPFDRVWAPLLQTAGSVLVVLGDSHGGLGDEPQQTTLHEHLLGPYQHVTLASATSLARLCGALNAHDKAYEIREDPRPTLTDLRSRPVVLIGALNNNWTMRLNDQLPFRFSSGTIARIIDTKNPAEKSWQLDFSKPFALITSDYAVVARYHDTATDGPIMIVGGLGPYGTDAAAEFVTSPHFLAQLSAKLPLGWENQNLEVVLKTDVIAGAGGPPTIVAATSW